MADQGSQRREIGANRATRTDPMPAGQEQIDYLPHPTLPLFGQASGTDDGPDRHNQHLLSIFRLTQARGKRAWRRQAKRTQRSRMTSDASVARRNEEAGGAAVAGRCRSSE